MENIALLEILKRKGILSDKEVNELSHDSSYLIPEEPSDRFGEKSSKEAVSKMYHMEGGRKYIGEKYDYSTAKEILERYRGVIPSQVTCYDMYVALNEHYHNYCSLFKSWFGDSIDTKIIESAIIYWFKDDDWNDVCKIWEYLKED